MLFHEIKMSSSHIATQTYAQRAAKHANPAARALLETIERKKSNLCVSVDVTSPDEFLKIIDTVGPYVCLIKVRRFSVVVSVHS